MGTPELLQAVLERHPRPDILVNEVDQHGWTALHYLCRRKHVTAEMLNVLLDLYPNTAKRVTAYGTTPLHRICCNEDVTEEAISTLIDHHPEATRQADKHGRTPLCLLCQNKTIEV